MPSSASSRLCVLAAAAVAVASSSSSSSFPFAAAQGPDPDLAVIKARLLASFQITQNVSGADEDLNGFLPLIQPDGTFSDLNYTGGKPTGWGGYTHCERMSEMGSAYVTPNSTFYQSATLRKAIAAVYESFWLVRQPQDPQNWWYQFIGCNKPVGQLALQFQGELSPEQLANVSSLLDNSVWNSFTSTGTNAADIGVVHIEHGLLTQNVSLVAGAFAKIYSTFSYAYSPPPTSPEGPKPDGSFMQHGPQLYNGNYGASWTKSGLLLIAIAANTTYNASGPGYDSVAHVTLDGCANMIHFPSLQWDVAVVGRQITNPGGQNVVGQGNNAYLLDPGVLRAAGGNRSAELNALADRLESPQAFPPPPPSMTVYYATDYVVVRRQGYMSSVRMISTRTAGGECINGQGLKSLHMADGAQYLYKTGFEYESAAPTWDWERLPGTTVQLGGTELNCSTADGDGQTDVVGGVTDGLVGLAYMQFNTTRYGQRLVANKAYFFFEDVFLNLGNGITTVPGFRVATTLESRLLDTSTPDAVHLSTTGAGGLSPLPQGNRSVPLPAAGVGSGAPSLLLHHANTGYAVFGDAGSKTSSLSILNQPVTGNWSSIGSTTGLITNPMFTASIDHGDGPVQDRTYAYFVFPNVTLAELQAGYAAAAAARYNVTRNDAGAQAVHDTTNHTLTAVLYSNTTVLEVPPDVADVGFVQTPFAGGVIVSSYLNTTSGNFTFKLNWFAPSLVISSTGPDSGVRSGHTENYYLQTGGRFNPCTWPSCPGQFPTPKGQITPPPLKWDCFANGTIHYVNPPDPAAVSEWMPKGAVMPPFQCEMVRN